MLPPAGSGVVRLNNLLFVQSKTFPHNFSALPRISPNGGMIPHDKLAPAEGDPPPRNDLDSARRRNPACRPPLDSGGRRGPSGAGDPGIHPLSPARWNP